MVNIFTQKWCAFHQGYFDVCGAVCHNNLGTHVFRCYFFSMTNTCNYSGLSLSFPKKLGTLQGLSWSGGAFGKEPSQKWKTVGSTNILIHTDTSGDEEVLPWSWMDISFCESGHDRKPGRIVFCSHLPWGKSRANSMIQMELLQISAGLNENIVFIY